MAIENINDYAGMWANGVNIGQLWDKIKEKFVSGAHVQSDATTYPASWKQQARANLGLTIGANKMWYGSAANTIGEVTTSTFGRGLLNTSSRTEITGLFAETAEKDKNGIEISENYAHSLAITDGYLRLKNNRYVSGTASAQDLSALQLNVKLGLLQLDNTGSAGKIPLVHIPDSIMGQLTYGGTITAYTQSTDSLTVSITTGAKAILEQKTGRTIGNKTVKLVATATDPSDTSSIAYFNYTDCTGIYFIWTADALTTHTGEPDYRVWPSGGPRYQAGDWLISNDTKWDKVDNTDAVTGVKGSNESAFRLGNVSIDALDVRALATYLTNTTQTVADKVQFNKDIWSLGGVAAYGISDLSAGGGGGGGLSGTIIRNWSNYQGAETEVLGANLGMRGFRMSGYSFQVNKPAVGADNWQTEFTLGTENIPDLPLTQITGTDDLQAIEALTATSGFLKKTAANTWSLATDVVTTAGQQALTNKTYNGYTLAAACAKGVDTSLTASSTSNNLPTSAAVASLISNYVKKAGDTMSGKLTITSENWDNQLALNRINNRNNWGATITFKRDSVTDTLLCAEAGHLYVSADNGSTRQKVWDEANDGSGSGLDADKLDGYEASGLFESLTNDNDQLKVQIGNTSKTLTLDYAKKATRFKSDSSFIDQSFIYRESPQTIDADSLVINKFKGQSLAWNVLTDNSSVPSTIDGFTYSKGTHNSYIMNGTGSTSRSGWLGISETTLILNHKYYVCVREFGGTGSLSYFLAGTDLPVGVGKVVQITSLDNSTRFTWGANGSISDKEFTCICVDLTAMFGSSNVPTASEFVSLYPEFYYPFCSGELINNDATSIETGPAGVNLWDEEWENAHFNSDTGVKLYYPDKVASKNFIKVEGGAAYYFKCPDYINVYFYNSSKTFISAWTNNPYLPKDEAKTIPSNAAYMRFSTFGQTTKVYNHNICINKSDESVNGKYYQYKANRLNLNLKDIKVKSHNIWDEEWEIGVYNLNTGVKENGAATQIRCKNKIAVEPNKTYYFKNATSLIWAVGYHQDGSYATKINSGYSFGNAVMVMPADVYYITFWTQSTYGGTYLNDICINESSSFNGRYEPHGILTIKGLKRTTLYNGTGPVYDEIISNKLIRRVAQKTGSQFSLHATSSAGYKTYKTNLADGEQISGGSGSAIAESQHQKNSFGIVYNGPLSSSTISVETIQYDGMGEYTFYISFNPNRNINDFVLNYALATPIEYELASPIPDTMPAGTTERIISDRSPVTPFACDMTYGANPKDILASAVPFSRLQDVRIERGAFTMSTQNDSNWYLVTLGDNKLYLRFTVNTGAFKLEMASDDTENPEYSKSFEFATLSTSDINEICV